MTEIILKNRAKCPECDDIITSKHRHDYVSCSCAAISVDGGKSYLRRAYKDKLPIEMSRTIPSFNDTSLSTFQTLYEDWIEYFDYWDKYYKDNPLDEETCFPIEHPFKLCYNFMTRNREKFEKHLLEK